MNGSYGSTLTCPDPPPATNYRIHIFGQKLWYEIGHIKTMEYAFWTNDCECTTFDITFYPYNDGIINEKCNKITIDNEGVTFLSEIKQYGNNYGEYKQIQIDPPIPNDTSYIQVIFLSDDYSAYYECKESADSVGYDYHILSSKPYMPSNEIQNLLQLTDEYNLNPFNVSFVYTNQTSCG